MAKLTKGEKRLKELEKEIKARKVRLGYERLQYAGLVLQSGLCWFKGAYYLFVDRRKKVSERIDLLEGALEELDRLAAEGKLERPFGEEAAPDLASGDEQGRDGESPEPAASEGKA